MKIKRFVVFAGNNYYPRGGVADYRASFDTLEEARANAAAKGRDDWTEIWDLETGETYNNDS